MNKSELVANVAAKAEITKKDAEKAVAAVFESIQGALVEGDKVQLIGFGTFETRTRAAREGRNPATKEVITIPPCSYVAFKASTMLKEGL